MNALELVKLLRQERGLDLPIVVVTGQGDEDSAVQTLKLGATDYLVKQGDLFHRLPVTLESAHLRVQLERERAALSESKARFQQMAEAIGDIFFLTNWSASRVLYVSPAYERLWREPVERLYEDGQSWFKPMHPEDRQRIQAQIPTTLGADFDAEFRVVFGDEVRHMHMRSRQVLDAQGQPFRRAGVEIGGKPPRPAPIGRRIEIVGIGMRPHSDVGVGDHRLKMNDAGIFVSVGEPHGMGKRRVEQGHGQTFH